jgi:hypothetical protein
MTENLVELMQPVTLPPLSWATGTVRQILVQPGERFYVFALRESDGTTIILRIANAHTGLPLADVAADNVLYDAMKEAYFRDLTIQVGFRDFGPDPQSGIKNLCIDRISLTR